MRLEFNVTGDTNQRDRILSNAVLISISTMSLHVKVVKLISPQHLISISSSTRVFNDYYFQTLMNVHQVSAIQRPPSVSTPQGLSPVNANLDSHRQWNADRLETWV